MKRLLNLFLLLTMFVVNAMATDYDLYVGGVQVTSANAGSIRALGDKGTAKYNATTKTLTISNAEISMLRTNKFIESNIDGLTIEFCGTNNIKVAQGDAFDIKKTTTLTCNPTETDVHLNITASSTQSIFALGSGNYVFKNIDITTAGGYFAKCATSTDVAKITFDNATVNHDATIQGTSRMLTAFTNISGIEFKNLCGITWPAVTKFSPEKKTILFFSDNTESPVRNFAIEKVCSGILLNGSYIPENYASDIYGDGKVSYDVRNKTLTFNDANITANAGCSIVESTIKGLYICIMNNNTFQGAAGAPIFNLQNATHVAGRGSDITFKTVDDSGVFSLVNPRTDNIVTEFEFNDMNVTSEGGTFLKSVGADIHFNNCKIKHTNTRTSGAAFEGIHTDNFSMLDCSFLSPDFPSIKQGNLINSKTSEKMKSFEIGAVDIEVNGIKVKKQNLPIRCDGIGHIGFNFKEKILEIYKNDVKCVDNQPLVRCNTSGVTILFRGDNKIQNNKSNIFELYGDVIIKSEDVESHHTFTVDGLGWRFIRSNGNIEIKDMNITTEKGSFAYSNDDTKTLTINNSEIHHTSSANYSIQNYDKLILNKSYFETPANAEYRDKSLYNPNSNNKVSSFTILRTKVYPLKVEGVEVTMDNNNDILGDGNVKYDIQNNVLTIEGTIRNHHMDFYYIESHIKGLKIIIKGNQNFASYLSTFLVAENTEIIGVNATIRVSLDRDFVHNIFQTIGNGVVLRDITIIHDQPTTRFLGNNNDFTIINSNIDFNGSKFAGEGTPNIVLKDCYIVEPANASVASILQEKRVVIKATGTSTAIDEKVNDINLADAPAYDLMGRKVNSSYKGIVIKNGEKILKK